MENKKVLGYIIMLRVKLDMVSGKMERELSGFKNQSIRKPLSYLNHKREMQLTNE